MKNQFVYMPLESYKERYTCLMSAKNGWVEQKFNENGIVNIIRVEGESLTSGKIEKGIVLDFFGRSYYSLTQNAELVKLIREGKIENNAVVYYDDFWTPGVEAVMYAAQLANIHLNIYAMLHAQSVDKFDFTYKLKNWMRNYEIGQSKFMKGIFVTSEYLKDLCDEAGFENVYFGGLPLNKKFLLSNFPKVHKTQKNRVVYCSRFDSEKNPLIFIEVARKLKDTHTFVMTTSFSTVNSNDSFIIEKIKQAQEEGLIEIKVNLSKKEYYHELQKANYIFNSAKQDWLSWTMLEGILYDCIPIYPKYRSFPEYLDSKYLYTENDPDSAIKVICSNTEFDKKLNNIVDYFDCSIERYIEIINATKEDK